ncbi:MAG: peptide-methionine (S)-S-oxide reductase MsrA [Akkermansiaceae bacterium]
MKRLLNVTVPIACLGIMLAFLAVLQTTHAKETMNDKKPTSANDVPDGFEKATFAAGCYWCVEAVFQRLDGVHSATSGFIDGHVENPSYEAVCAGVTGHTEAVEVIFDPKEISFETLLDWFWRLHDPTQLNRQGADVGTQYRSGVYYHNLEQKKMTEASKLAAQDNFPKPIVTEVKEATTFYPAKISHQDYYKINGSTNGYCRAVIAPKLKKLKLE